MESIGEYGMFLAKTLTVVFVAGMAAVVAAGFANRANALRKSAPVPRVTYLNRRHGRMVAAFERKSLPRREWRRRRRAEKGRARRRLAESGRRRVFVLDFKGDVHARGVAGLREEVTLVLANAADTDQVVVRMDNAGGAPSGHGLGASQLARIRRRGIELVVTIDRVAASGGYMMACVAHRIVAAPFALVGSIGTYTMVPNINRLLESRGIDVESFQSGEFKTTVTPFGKNTESGRAKFQQQLEALHAQFKDFVAEHRPALDIERVSTGEYWTARDARELGLVDEIRTSDDYLMELGREADLYLVRQVSRRGLRGRVREAVGMALDRVGLHLGSGT